MLSMGLPQFRTLDLESVYIRTEHLIDVPESLRLIYQEKMINSKTPLTFNKD